MISLKHCNVVHLKAICLQPSAILSEFVYFDFHCFSDETCVYNLAEFLCQQKLQLRGNHARYASYRTWFAVSSQ